MHEGWVREVNLHHDHGILMLTTFLQGIIRHSFKQKGSRHSSTALTSCYSRRYRHCSNWRFQSRQAGFFFKQYIDRFGTSEGWISCPPLCGNITCCLRFSHIASTS
jgi:hypothetical protein